MVIFTLRRLLQFARDSDGQFSIDGTFDITPMMFAQTVIFICEVASIS